MDVSRSLVVFRRRLTRPLTSTFSWVLDLIDRGTKKELEEKDVPELSPSFQSKPVYLRFMEFQYVAFEHLLDSC